MKKLTILNLIFLLIKALIKHGNLNVKIWKQYVGFVDPTYVHVSDPLIEINGVSTKVGKFFEIS